MIGTLRTGDLVAVGVAAALIVALSVAVYAGPSVTGSQVTVQAEGERFVYSLEDSQRLTFEGPLGVTVVRIADGAVSVIEDPGPLQICVQQGEVRRAGEWLACLPNEVFIRVEGDTPPGGVDGHAF
ncbi:MAG: NusG domain II-containing protein [bacterium]